MLLSLLPRAYRAAEDDERACNICIDGKVLSVTKIRIQIFSCWFGGVSLGTRLWEYNISCNSAIKWQILNTAKIGKKEKINLLSPW